jgi:hypothetical protein
MKLEMTRAMFDQMYLQVLQHYPEWHLHGLLLFVPFRERGRMRYFRRHQNASATLDFRYNEYLPS